MDLEPGIEAHECIYIDTPEQAGGSGSSAGGRLDVCQRMADCVASQTDTYCAAIARCNASCAQAFRLLPSASACMAAFACSPGSMRSSTLPE